MKLFFLRHNLGNYCKFLLIFKLSSFTHHLWKGLYQPEFPGKLTVVAKPGFKTPDLRIGKIPQQVLFNKIVVNRVEAHSAGITGITPEFMKRFPIPKVLK